jgi:hypothetical protein
MACSREDKAFYFQLICQHTTLRSPVATVAVALSELITKDVPAVTVPTERDPMAVDEPMPQRVNLYVQVALAVQAVIVETVTVPDDSVAIPVVPVTLLRRYQLAAPELKTVIDCPGKRVDGIWPTAPVIVDERVASQL